MIFLRKIAIYTIPFAVLFLLLTGGLAYSGESMPLGLVLRLQASDTPVLYRVKYGNLDQRFKRLAVDYFQPEVMVIGSSLVLQFREAFLNRNPDAFYNAAAPAWQLEEVSHLLYDIHHHPDIIILGIDDPWFNADYAGDPIVEPPVSDYARFFIVNRTFLQEVLEGKTFDIQAGPSLVQRQRTHVPHDSGPWTARTSRLLALVVVNVDYTVFDLDQHRPTACNARSSRVRVGL